MATRTISNAGGNYNSTSTWVEAAIPTSADTVVATSTSGPLTVNVASSAGVLMLTAYTNTLTMSNTLSVYGNITLGSGMTSTGTAALQIMTGATLTSNNKPWNAPLNFASISNSTITLADNWTGNSKVTNATAASTRVAINGNNFYCKDTLAVGGSGIISGTTKFILAGTGSFSGGNSATYIQNDVDINTSGTITFGPTLLYNSGTLTYISGNTITTGCQLDVAAGTTTKLQTSGMTWMGNVINTNTAIVQLLSDLKIYGSLINQINPLVINATGSSVYIGSGITTSGGGISGTAPLILTGSGIWQGSGAIKNNLNINTSGTIQVVGSVAYNTGVLSYSSGTVNTSASTLNVGAATILNTKGSSSAIATTVSSSGINFNNITFSNSSAFYTLTSNLSAINLLTVQGSFSGTGIIYLNGGLTATNLVGGNNQIIMQGNGTLQSTNSTFAIRNPLTINTSGTIFIGTNLAYNTGTLTYSAGTVITTGSTLNMAGSTTLNTNGIFWNNLIFVGTSAIYTLQSDLYSSGTTSFTGLGSPSINGFTHYCTGTLTSTAAASYVGGTTNLYLSGNSIWAGSSGGYNCSIILGGNVTLTNTLYFGGGSIINSGATIVSDTSTINRFSNLSTLTFNTAGLLFNNVILSNNITLNSNLSANTLTNGSTTYFGNFGFNANTYTVGAGATVNLVSGVTYNVFNNLFLNGASPSTPIVFKSNTNNQKAYFNLSDGALCNAKFVSATDIDSSGGRLITDVKGTLLRTINWYKTNPDYYSFF